MRSLMRSSPPYNGYPCRIGWVGGVGLEKERLKSVMMLLLGGVFKVVYIHVVYSK
jgi:hypothetical protein